MRRFVRLLLFLVARVFPVQRDYCSHLGVPCGNVRAVGGDNVGELGLVEAAIG